MLRNRLVIVLCLTSVFCELIEPVKPTRYYIVVPVYTPKTSALFKQRQLTNSTLDWVCQDGINPIVYPLNDIYKIQAISILLDTHQYIDCIGLHVQVVEKKKVVYAWQNEDVLQDTCDGFLTKTNKLAYNELVGNETLTIDFHLSPLIDFEVYSVKPKLECLEKTQIVIKQPKLYFDKTSPVKPKSCSVFSAMTSFSGKVEQRDMTSLSNITCNMSLLAQFGNVTKLETFSVVNNQTMIPVPSFIWGFSPSSVVCRAKCALTRDKNQLPRDIRVATETYQSEYVNRPREEHVIQAGKHMTFYKYCSYTLGALVVVGILLIIALAVRCTVLKRKIRARSPAQTFVDSGGYSRIIRPSVTHHSLPISRERYTEQQRYSTLARDIDQRYNTVSLRISEYLSETNQNLFPTVPSCKSAPKIYEKLTF